MSGPVQPPLTVETVDGATVGRPITRIKVTNGTLTVSGNTATIVTGAGGGGGSGTVTSVGTSQAFITITNPTTTPSISIGNASGAATGVLTAASFNTFDAKQDAITLTTTGTSGAASFAGGTLNIPQYTDSGGTVTSVGTSQAFITITNPTTTPSISIGNASGAATGVLTATGWSTFNGKQDSITLTTTGTSGAASFAGGTLNIPQYTGGGGGGAPTDGEYVVMALNGTLTNERVLTAGTGISLTDGGAGSTATITNSGVTNIIVTAPISSTFGSTPTLSLASSGVTPGSYTNTDLTVDANGMITAASNGSGGGSVSFPLNGPDDSASAPNYSWTNASTSGLFRLTSSTVGISAGGGAAMYFQTSKVEANKTFEVLAGSAGTPSLTFSGDGNTGFFSSGADEIGFTVGGNERMTLKNNGVYGYGFRVDGGHSEADPGYSFDADSDTGMFNSSANTVGFATGGTERLRIGASGEILIGGTSAGTSGQVLTSAGASSPPTWSTAGGGGGSVVKLPKIGSTNENQYLISASAVWGSADISGSTSMTSADLGKCIAFPFIAATTGSLTAASIYINTGGVAETTLYLGFYSQDSDNLPSTLLGYATMDTSSTGSNTVTSFSSTVSLTAGEQYWYTVNMADSGTSTVLRSHPLTSVASLGIGSLITEMGACIYDNTMSAYAVPPSTFSADLIFSGTDRPMASIKF